MQPHSHSPPPASFNFPAAASFKCAQMRCCLMSNEAPMRQILFDVKWGRYSLMSNEAKWRRYYLTSNEAKWHRYYLTSNEANSGRYCLTSNEVWLRQILFDVKWGQMRHTLFDVKRGQRRTILFDVKWGQMSTVKRICCREVRRGWQRAVGMRPQEPVGMRPCKCVRMRLRRLCTFEADSVIKCAALCLVHTGIHVGFFYVNKMGTKQHSGDVHMGPRLRMQDFGVSCKYVPHPFFEASFTSF